MIPLAQIHEVVLNVLGDAGHFFKSLPGPLRVILRFLFAGGMVSFPVTHFRPNLRMLGQSQAAAQWPSSDAVSAKTRNGPV